jgi:hypothetical protein
MQALEAQINVFFRALTTLPLSFLFSVCMRSSIKPRQPLHNISFSCHSNLIYSPTSTTISSLSRLSTTSSFSQQIIRKMVAAKMNLVVFVAVVLVVVCVSSGGGGGGFGVSAARLGGIPIPVQEITNNNNNSDETEEECELAKDESINSAL